MEITSNLSPNLKPSVLIEGMNQLKTRIVEEIIPKTKKKSITFFFFNLSPPFNILKIV